MLMANERSGGPKLVAGDTLVGPSFHVTEHRGELLDHPDRAADDLPGGWALLATVHPSAVLRAEDRDQAYRDLVADLRPVAERVRSR